MKIAAQGIRVAVRVRPLSEEETEQSRESIHEIYSVSDNSVIYSPNLSFGSKTFDFDRIFDPTSSINSVYEQCVSEIIENSTEGKNGAIFSCKWNIQH
jgi:iron only hydrogenase large subunit-like protein